MIGPNGAGKSTLLKCLMYLLKPQTGTIFIFNQDLSQVNYSDIAKLRASVLSDRVYPFNMTVKEIVSLGRQPHQSLLGKHNSNDKKIIFESVKLLGIEEFLDKKFSELSDGQKQKVLIARAISQKPKVLILDEPATHLDAKSRIEILLKLRQIARCQKITIIASMHEIEIAYRISDRVIVLEDGKINSFSHPEEIFNNGTVNNIYDIQKTVWHPVFGSLEIKSRYHENSKIHVVGGYGTGIPIYRLLSRLELPFSTGILDKIDVDYYLAKEINVEIFSNSMAYEPISFEKTRILEKSHNFELLIDCGFPVNQRTSPNIELIKRIAEGKNIQIYSLRSDSEIENIYGKNFNVRNGSMAELEKFLQN